MNDYEDFIIDEAYVRTPEDDALIHQASPNGNHSTDWENDCLDDFKHRVRDYYLKKQHRYCAYCRTKIKTSQAQAEIEHIVAKSNKSGWMYDPFNMCASCKSCNTKKSTKKVLADYDGEALTKISTDYKIIHPHLDKYSQHINILDGIFYVGITDKGKNTITTCVLDRYELAADRAEEIIKNEGDIYEHIMLALTEKREKPLVNVVDTFVERIKEMISDYKANTAI